MRNSLYILASIFILMSCNSNTIIKKPENLISKEKMTDILVDTYIAKAAKNVTNINKDRNINYLSLIYQNHQTDSITFENSLKYYTANISEHQEILKATQQKLKLLLTEAEENQKSEEELKKVQDSIEKNKKLDKEIDFEGEAIEELKPIK